MKELVLLPYPQRVEFIEDSIIDYNIEPAVIFNDNYGEEEYYITAQSNSIVIKCKGELGKYRALTTLNQIKAQNLTCGIEISDFPNFPNRGIMLDISRGKIPTLKTLKHLVNIFSNMKINELQLYVEGFSFAYKSFPQVWENGTPLTAEEIMELDEYCKSKYIKLVPNQNCFGHMSAWLERDEFNHLAECPNGFQLDAWDYLSPHCLDPNDEGSLELVKKLFDDVLPYYSSDTVNINCDETLELGRGKNKEICEQDGKTRVYVEFLKKIIDYVSKKKNKVQFWGDIVSHNPELLEELPDNVIAINWGYSPNTPAESNSKAFSKSKLSFYNAPGTASWNTILGDTECTFDNIDFAVSTGKKYGAIGILNTDWGDLNHLHYIPISYPSFAYGAARSWNSDKNQRDILPHYLNKFVFNDSSDGFSQFLLEAGKYHNVADFSKTQRGLVVGILYYPLEGKKWESLSDGFTAKELNKLLVHLDYLESKLSGFSLGCDDGALIKSEIKNAILILKYTVFCALYKISAYCALDKDKHLELLHDIQNIFIPEHRRLWLSRNKISGLEKSIIRMQKVDMPLEKFAEFYPFSNDFVN